MKRIFVFMIMIAMLFMCIVPATAQNYNNYTTYGITYQNYISENLTDAFETSGESVAPVRGNLEITVRLTFMYGNTQNDRNIQSYWNNTIRPILLQYDGDGVKLKRDLDGILEFGDKTRQPVDYYKIDYIGSNATTGRFCFLNHYGAYSTNTKIMKYQNSALFMHVFDLTFKVSNLSQFSKYQVGYGDVDEWQKTDINDGFYFYPIVFMEDFFATNPPSKEQDVYMSVNSVNVHYNTSPSIYNLIGNQNSPVVVLCTNMNKIYLDAMMGDDRNYVYYSYQYSNLNLKLGNNVDSIELQIPTTDKTGFSHNLADGRKQSDFYWSYDYYNTKLFVNDLQCFVSDYKISFDNYMIDSANNRFNFYMRVSCYGEYKFDVPAGTVPYDRFDNFPVSVSSYVLYKPSVNLGQVNNNEFTIGNITPDSLKRDTSIRFNSDGNLFQDIARFFEALFVVVIPNIINNFIVWLFMEAPLLSNVTAPMFTLVYSTGSIITRFMLPLVGAVGVLGIAFVLVLVIKLIKRLVK